MLTRRYYMTGYDIAVRKVGELSIQLEELQDKYNAVSEDCNTLRIQHEALQADYKTLQKQYDAILKRMTPEGIYVNEFYPIIPFF